MAKGVIKVGDEPARLLPLIPLTPPQGRGSCEPLIIHSPLLDSRLP